MYDVIVIGTGIGGLTAAGLLAGVAGKKVLLLEKHTEPGGLTHVFRRDGAAWDVGLHYVGEVGPGTPGRALFDYLSGGELKWNRMPEALERFIYPGMDFAVPSEPARYQQKLIEAFPDEARAIRRYFRDIRRVVRWTMLGFMRGMVPRAVEPVLRLLQQLTATKATQTTQAYLEAHFSSPELRALLASQWGDYGLPPSRSAFAIHAQIVSHYLQGAWFPDGGAGRIVRTFEQGIERQGGSIRVAQEVLEILLEDGRAVGVRVMDSRGPQAQERVYRAAHVISNVGAQLTYQQLLPTTGAVGQATADVRALMARLGSGYSAVTLYLRLQQSARTLGVKGENVWVNTDLNHEDIEGQTRGVLQGAPRSIYVSFPSLKSGDDKFHTAEVIAFVDDRAFEAWRGSAKGQRGTDYAALKARISAGLLALAETAIPGLSGLVAYAELATPLTVEHYTAHPGGRFYGLPASPERYRSPLLGPRTPVTGLYLAGQDAACLGILGAMWGGVGAACQVLGARGYPMIQAALKAASRAGARQTPPAAAEQAPLPKEKRHAVLTAKQRLTPSIWQVEFQMQGAGELAAYAAGQFARLRVGPNEWRDYSIASLQGATVRLLISTRTGGQGSGFIENATLGTRTQMELPLGQYTLLPNAHRQVFIATGTGIAPFLAMFAALEQQERLGAATLFFGSPTCDQDISRHLGPLPGTVVRCISREQAPAGGFTGRVTQALQHFAFIPDTTDFYVCGSSAMVADCQALLQKRGARQVLVEAF